MLTVYRQVAPANRFLHPFLSNAVGAPSFHSFIVERVGEHGPPFPHLRYKIPLPCPRALFATGNTSDEQELPVSPASIERDASLTFHPEPIGPHNTTDARSMERRVAGGCHGCRSIESVRTGKQPSLIPLCYSAHSQSRHACYIPGHGQLGATDERSFRHSTRPHSS